MRPTFLKTTPWLLALLFLGTISTADAKTRYVEERSYVGVFGQFASISDDPGIGFDGIAGVSRSYSSGVTTYSLIPKIKDNYGFGGLVGYRRGDYAAEVSYARSSHKAEYDGEYFWGTTGTFQDTATYNAFNVNLKRYLFTYLPIQPYVLGGLCFPWLVVENATIIDGPEYSWYINSASYSGMGFNLGVGLEFFVMPNVTITGGAIRRWNDFSHLRGASKQSSEVIMPSLDDVPMGIKDSSFNFHAGATIDFM